MKNLICAFLLVGTAAMADVPKEKFVMHWTCADNPICTQQAGPYGLGTTFITPCHRYEQIDDRQQSTCCQLAGGIHQQLCRDGYAPEGREVICEE